MQDKYFEKIYFLSRCKSFASLEPEVLGALAEKTFVLKAKKEQKIVIEDIEIKAIYVVSFGSLNIHINNTKVAVVSTGALLGDQEIITGETDSRATVIVDSEYALLLQIPRSDFEYLIQHYPSLAVEITRSFAQRSTEMKQKVEQWDKLSERIMHDLGRLESSLDVMRKMTVTDQNKTTIIELRYLVSIDINYFENVDQQRLWQGYITNEGNDEIRIRKECDKHTITGKRDIAGHRTEIELTLPPPLFNALSNHVGEQVVAKRRFFIEHYGFLWRLDVFDDKTRLGNLIIAEVDITEDDETPQPPPGITIIKDISNDERYRNRNLAKKGPPAL